MKLTRKEVDISDAIKLVQDSRDHQTIEEVTDLVCKYGGDFLREFGGLSKFVDWFRSLRPDLYAFKENFICFQGEAMTKKEEAEKELITEYPNPYVLWRTVAVNERVSLNKWKERAEKAEAELAAIPNRVVVSKLLQEIMQLKGYLQTRKARGEKLEARVKKLEKDRDRWYNAGLP